MKPALHRIAVRQPTTSISAASGAWPSAAPLRPTSRVRPLTMAKRCGGSHSTASVSAPTQETLEPAPIRKRPKAAISSDCVVLKTAAPTALSTAAPIISRPGPMRSIIRPSGICSSA